MNTKKLLMSSAFYSFGNMGGAALNMLFQFILMMFLTTDEYGIIQPLLQFIGLLVLPASAYQYALTKHYSELTHNEIENESIYIFRKTLIFSIIVTIFWLLLIPLLKNFFHIENGNIFIFLVISLILQIIAMPFMSRLQAEKQFLVSGLTQLSQGIVRMTIGCVIVFILPNIFGAILGVIISNLALLFGNSFLYFKTLLKKLPNNFSPKPISLKLLFVSLGSVGLFSLLVYSDTVLVRSFAPELSGLFATSNLLGKGMIFLTTGISFVILPLLAGKFHYPVHYVLWVGFLFLVILVISYTGFFAIVAPFLAKILFKNEPFILDNFSKYLTFYNIMFVPYPLIYYFLNYYLVKEHYFYPIILFIANIFLYIGIVMFNSNLNMIINVIGIVGYITLFIVILHAIFSKNK